MYYIEDTGNNTLFLALKCLQSKKWNKKKWNYNRKEKMKIGMEVVYIFMIIQRKSRIWLRKIRKDLSRIYPKWISKKQHLSTTYGRAYFKWWRHKDFRLHPGSIWWDMIIKQQWVWQLFRMQKKRLKEKLVITVTAFEC